jgi:threonine/homoserine/homoserine lactone efflux protein
MEVIGVPCMTVWALFGTSLKRFMEAPAGRRAFNVSMALALGVTAVMMVR